MEEWFGLSFFADIALTASDPEGYYQFATTSDDGALLLLDIGNGFKTAINQNPYSTCHGNTTNSATTAVYMKRGTPIHMALYYFQAPGGGFGIQLKWKYLGTSIPGTLSYYDTSVINPVPPANFFGPTGVQPSLPLSIPGPL